jgi:hypothetical protein
VALVFCDKNEFLVFWPLPVNLEPKKKLITHKNPMNILGIGFDSMSHANYIRSLPKTLEVIRNKLNKTGNLFELNGYTIVGDGTTANLGGILTGQHEFSLPEARRKQPNSTYVDNWPWIWKDAEASGYVTSYLEDEPAYGAFTLRLNGFKDIPTDYYSTKYWEAVGNYTLPSYHYEMWDWVR